MCQAMILFASLLCLSSLAPCQTVDPQTKTMEAVLSEIRQLRQDLQVAATAARKAQIVIYRLHVQAGIVERATERVDGVKRELTLIENQKRYQAEQLKRLKEMREQEGNEENKKRLEASMDSYEENLAGWGAREEELQTQRIELESQLRAEQAKWARLDEELDRLENELERTAIQASARQPQKQ